MARAGILYSHVAAAASRLAGEGKNPTVDTVRAALGATGSKSTIAPMLKRWKEEHAGTVAEAASGLPSALLQAVKQVYDGLRTDATGQLEQAILAHRDELKAIQAEATQLRTQATVLAEEKSMLAADLARACAEAVQLRAELQSQSVVLAATQSENAGLTQRLADRAAEVATVNQQLTHARTQFEHYQESSVAQRTEERQSFERRIAQQDHELGRLRQHLELKQSASAQHAGHLARMTEEHTRLEQELRLAQQQLGQLRAECDRIVLEAAALAAGRTQMAAAQETLQRQLGDASSALAVREREMALAGDRLASAEQRAEVLVRDQLSLLQQQARLETELRLLREATQRAD